jgi:hypothetical protein
VKAALLTARQLCPLSLSIQIASSARRLPSVYKGMDRTSRTKGRLALLATPLVAAALALALSACGALASTSSSAPSSSSAPTGSSAPSGTSAPSDASAVEFCRIWQEAHTTLSQMKTILDYVPADGMSTPASEVQPTMQAIGEVFNSLDQVAPASISGSMATLTSYWNQVVADFQYGTTVGQVEAYIQAHPPAPAATINAAVQNVSDFLIGTCHINIGS